MTDISSQQVSFFVTANATPPMASVRVYLDNVSLGTVGGPFMPGSPRLVSLGIPTTISIKPGQSYRVVIEGIYASSVGGATAEYWEAIDVVASGG